MSTKVLQRSHASDGEADICDSDLHPVIGELIGEIGEKDEDLVVDSEALGSSDEAQLPEPIDPLLVEGAASSTITNSREVDNSESLDNDGSFVERMPKRSTQHISFLSAPISSDELLRSRARGSRINSDSKIDGRMTNTIETRDLPLGTDGGQGGGHGFGGRGGDGNGGGDDGGHGWAYIMTGFFLVCSAVALNFHRRNKS